MTIRQLAYTHLRALALCALCAAFVLAWGLGMHAAFAQTATATAAPIVPATDIWGWGAQLAQGVTWLGGLAAIMVGGLIAKYAPALVKSYLTQQAVTRAFAYATAMVSGAVSGKALTLAQANTAIGIAERFLVNVEPTVAGWLGPNITAWVTAHASALGALPAEAGPSTLPATAAVPLAAN